MFQVGWGFLQEVIRKLVQAQGCLTVNLIPPERRAERKAEWEMQTVKGNREELQQDLMSSYPWFGFEHIADVSWSAVESLQTFCVLHSESRRHLHTW